MKLPNPILIQTDAALEAMCRTCSQAKAVAVDTEFMRTDTFFPLLGLVQVSDGETVWLVDPLAVNNNGPLVQLLTDSAVVKVFHSCSEDLEVMLAAYNVVPEPLFDTQVAAAFLGYGFSRGYANLVEQVLGLQLDKHETRSDWMQRPLTDSQCRYAAEDVYYLMKVYQVLADKLAAQGRDAWVAADMAELVNTARQPLATDQYYLRVKGAWKLSPAELGLLQQLASWREREARDRDRPRNRVVADTALLELAKRQPDNRQQLAQIEGIFPGIVRRYGETLLDLIAEEHNRNEALTPLPEPLSRDGRLLLSQYRKLLDAKAEAMAMAPEILAKKKDLELLVRSQQSGEIQLPDSLASGWRYQLIGEELLQHDG